MTEKTQEKPIEINVLAPATLHEKLVEIQKELKVPKNQFNKFGGYNFRSAEDILATAKPLVNAMGLALTCDDDLVMLGNRYYVKATVSLSDGVSSATRTAFAREPENKKGMDESQITGTASSYARKYALNGLFAIDDVKDADSNEHAVELKARPEPVLELSKEDLKSIQSAETVADLKVVCRTIADRLGSKYTKLIKTLFSNRKAVIEKPTISQEETEAIVEDIDKAIAGK